MNHHFDSTFATRSRRLKSLVGFLDVVVVCDQRFHVNFTTRDELQGGGITENKLEHCDDVSKLVSGADKTWKRCDSPIHVTEDTLDVDLSGQGLDEGKLNFRRTHADQYCRTTGSGCLKSVSVNLIP